MADPTLAHLAKILRRDFAAFVERSYPVIKASDAFQPNWHIEVIAEKLEAVRTGKIMRLIINLPPRHLKSIIGSVAFPAFILGHKPSTEVLCVSYGQDLADDFARKCLNVMRSPFYKAVFGTRLDPNRQTPEEFLTLGGGCRRASSVLGGLTGRGADIIIIDDPIKAGDSQSEARRETVNDEFYNTIYSRLNNKETGAIVIIMQRLHGNDLTAYVQEKEKWDVVAFPAIAERHEVYDIRTPYGEHHVVRRNGEALHPARESLSTLNDIRSRDEYVFAAQYQQDPQPESGVIVKRDWIQRFDLNHPPQFETILQSWDTASKATELSDYSVCTTWGLNRRRLYLIDEFRKKMEFPELKQMVRHQAEVVHQASVVLVEDSSSGIQLIQQLRDEDFFIVERVKTAGEDKIMRLHAQTAKIKNGAALFPEKAPWIEAYLFELTAFPNGKHDDRVDSTIYALNWLTVQSAVPGAGLLEWYRQEAAKLPIITKDGSNEKLYRIRAKCGASLYCADGTRMDHAQDQTLRVTHMDAVAANRSGEYELIDPLPNHAAQPDCCPI